MSNEDLPAEERLDRWRDRVKLTERLARINARMHERRKAEADLIDFIELLREVLHDESSDG